MARKVGFSHPCTVLVVSKENRQSSEKYLVHGSCIIMGNSADAFIRFKRKSPQQSCSSIFFVHILQFYRQIKCFDLEFRGESAEAGEST